MNDFIVTFEFENSSSKQIMLKKDSYASLESEIKQSPDGWWSVEGELINLNKVLSVKIVDLSERRHLS